MGKTFSEALMLLNAAEDRNGRPKLLNVSKPNTIDMGKLQLPSDAVIDNMFKSDTIEAAPLTEKERAWAGKMYAIMHTRLRINRIFFIFIMD